MSKIYDLIDEKMNKKLLSCDLLQSEILTSEIFYKIAVNIQMLIGDSVFDLDRVCRIKIKLLTEML